MTSRQPIARVLLIALFSGASFSGCVSSRIPRRALTMEGPTLEVRQLSTRRFATQNEKEILAASASLLQDLGFTVENSETDLGLIVASKQRSAVETGQVIGKVAWAVLFWSDLPIDRNQLFRASVVTKTVGSEIMVRVTFQRIVWNDRNQVTKLERLVDPSVYQQFFDRLSKAVFLEAQQI